MIDPHRWYSYRNLTGDRRCHLWQPGSRYGFYEPRCCCTATTLDLLFPATDQPHCPQCGENAARKTTA